MIAIDTTEKEKIIEALITFTLLWLFRRGELPEDALASMTPEDIFLLLVKKIREGEMSFAVDHSPKLLRKARSDLRRRDDHEALLHYATFFEHKVNSIIRELCLQAGESEGDVIERIRRNSLKDKASKVFLELAEKPLLSPDVIEKMDKISWLRNEYVHHKGRDETYEEGLAIRAKLESAEEVVKALDLLEDLVLYGGRKRQLKKKSPKPNWR